jgi:hypothetical protein
MDQGSSLSDISAILVATIRRAAAPTPRTGG